jgi:hypothetical protein
MKYNNNDITVRQEYMAPEVTVVELATETFTMASSLEDYHDNEITFE